MGIPGLTTYVAQRSDICFQYYELSDTYLVIDGNSLSSQLYCQLRNSNGCFGGDYDCFANLVSNFFDELLQCRVVPLVIIDGGAEDKKLKTIMDRTRDRIVAAASMNPRNQARSRLFPLLLKEVFKEVVCQKNIRYAQALFEADDDLASVAKLLDCPVLSCDSDFYVFDVMYIPFPSIDRGVRRKANGQGWAKRCKMYRIDNFLRMFPQMQRSLMPMAAALLGNDYVKRSVFKDFFSSLRLPRASKRRHNEMQRRIEAVFYFLQKNNLNGAVGKVLCKIKPQHRQSVLKILEMIINGYLLCSPTMLNPLGFDPQEIHSAVSRVHNEPFKYIDQPNINQQEESNSEDESDLDLSEKDQDNTDQSPVVLVEQPDTEKKICQILPAWFVREFQQGHFPSYFMDMLSRQFYVCPVQVEDFSQNTCMTVSLKLVKTIFGLLSKGTINKDSLKCFMRGRGNSTQTRELKVEDESLPGLSDLRNISADRRKQMLNDFLGVTDDFLKKFPPDWRLYVATIKYWADEVDSQFRTNCHVYALMMCMLFHVVDQKIGFFRSQNHLENKLGKDLQVARQQKDPIINSNQQISIYEALQQIRYEDCLLAAPFYTENFELHQNVLMNPKKFNISIVHAFSLFQNCLRHASHLNSLLGNPYEQMKISQLFNGTLLYNLFNKFKSHNDLKHYVGVIFEDSPGLLKLFRAVESALFPVLDKAFANVVNSARKRRNKRNKPSTSFGAEEVVDEIESDGDEYDGAGNRYALLKTR